MPAYCTTLTNEQVAHVVAQLRRNILGYRIKSLDLPHDTLLFPQLKTAPDPAATLHHFSGLLTQSIIRDVGRHGKYFWIRTETPSKVIAVILLHFGMTGMVKMRGIDSHFIMMENGGDKLLKKELLADSSAEPLLDNSGNFSHASKDLRVDTPEKQVATSGPLKAESADGAPKVESTDGFPKAESTDCFPKVESADGAPKVESTDGFPEVESSGAESTDGPTFESVQVSDTFLNHFASVNQSEEWPPRFTKFQLFLEHPNSTNTIDFAFTDPRRLGRVQILSGPEYATNAALLENCPSLNKLGPDYSKPANAVDEEAAFEKGDPDPQHHGKPRLDLEHFARLVLTKKKPIKAFLLDQHFFAGIGNWVSDEILYHAQIYPGETLSLKITDPSHPALKRLYDSIIYVMEESVRLEGNARDFPKDWLMIHRWGKGRKQQRAKVSRGYSVDFETIGGRTCCFVKELQKPLKRRLSASQQSGDAKSPVSAKASAGSATQSALPPNGDEKPPKRRSTRGRN